MATGERGDELASEKVFESVNNRCGDIKRFCLGIYGVDVGLEIGQRC